MNWSSWLILGVALLGLYLLGLTGYRLLLSVRALQLEISRTRELTGQLQNLPTLEIEPATPYGQQDLAKALRNRRQIQAKNEKRREARQRRLVQRISEIEIDKR